MNKYCITYYYEHEWNQADEIPMYTVDVFGDDAVESIFKFFSKNPHAVTKTITEYGLVGEIIIPKIRKRRV